jgi:hypothetical protein
LHWSFESERYFGKTGREVKATRVVNLLPRRCWSYYRHEVSNIRMSLLLPSRLVDRKQNLKRLSVLRIQICTLGHWSTPLGGNLHPIFEGVTSEDERRDAAEHRPGFLKSRWHTFFWFWLVSISLVCSNILPYTYLKHTPFTFDGHIIAFVHINYTWTLDIVHIFPTYLLSGILIILAVASALALLKLYAVLRFTSEGTKSTWCIIHPLNAGRRLSCDCGRNTQDNPFGDQ